MASDGTNIGIGAEMIVLKSRRYCMEILAEMKSGWSSWKKALVFFKIL